MKASARRFSVLALLVFPFVALALQLAAWAKWGVDIPYWDDWRIFDRKEAGSLALRDLFHPANDTIYATGKVLDALAVRFIDYNAVVYQFLSMLVCLGTILFFQFLLLKKSCRLPSFVPAFVATLFLLQPGGYWGSQCLAYHQVLPLIFLLLSLWVVLHGTSRCWIPVALLGIVSGFTYISGAFTVAMACVVSFVFSLRADPDGARRLRDAALGFAVAAVITLPVQLGVILIHQHGRVHIEGAAWAYPWTWGYWLFLFGVIGRVFTLHLAGSGKIGVMVATSLALLLGAAMVAPLWFLIPEMVQRRKRTLQTLRLDYIYAVLFAVVALYLLLLAGARAGSIFRPADDWGAYYGAGAARLYFFWVAFLVPCLVAILAQRFYRVSAGKIKPLNLGIVFSILLLVFSVGRGAMDYSRFYKRMGVSRAQGVECLQAKILSGDPVECPMLIQGMELTEPIRYARAEGISFTKKLRFSDESRGPEDGVSTFDIQRPLQK